MSFKDLDSGNKIPARAETPEEAEMRAKAAARHKAKEARREEHRAGKKAQPQGGATRRDPQEE
jgi:hypothetical protein